MNVLHVNQSDINGGAAIAGYRLHQGLLTQGVDSNLLVGSAKTDSDRIAVLPRKHRIENKLSHLSRQLGLNYTNIISSFDIADHPFHRSADIINFHNLHTGYFNYLALTKLTEKKPAVFTLHDMWSFTGHCAYAYDCQKWKTGCGHCPYPDTYPAIRRDNTNLEWRLKQWVYSHANLTVVAPSRWLTEQAKQSMLDRFPIHHIPYGIDTHVYQPLNTGLCRVALGIPARKRVLMCGAHSLTDPRKGGDLLIATLQNLPKSLKMETVLLLLGNGGETITETVGIPVVQLGYVSSDRLKAIAYSAADLFIFPTRADNLPLVLQESMACGTPMVSFKVGGVPDVVRPGITGYLAEAESEDFTQGIVQLLEDHNLRYQMKQSCREIAVTEYPLELQAKRYVGLYQKIQEAEQLSKNF
jgi:glycosyltransferase involved in cell wall biosynthesis